MPTRTEAISRFLLSKTHPDLAKLYTAEMEVQVNVAKDNGEKEQGEYNGHKYVLWTDGVEKWKPFRIPYKAMTENPEYKDVEMSFSLDKHAEGIGMTGWNWVRKQSLWCAYDFDTIIGHSDKHTKKLSDAELESIRKIVENVPWVTLRRSTGGGGLHLYVALEGVTTATHSEHAALARSILHMLSGITGYEFTSKVDTCGGNMWVWHRKMKGEGLVLLKQGIPLTEIPKDWRNHVPVVTNRAPRVMLQDIKEQDIFDQLSGQRAKLPLDTHHKALIAYLQENKAFWWWDNDLWMLVTHTSHLKDAHGQLKMLGRFETLATGEEKGHDHNCFAYPLRGGSWVVRRYTQKTAEAPTWQVDSKQWTRCFLNRKPDYGTVCMIHEAIEHPSGGYHFSSLKGLKGAMRDLGLDMDMPYAELPDDRKATVMAKKKDDTKLIISIESMYREQSRVAKAVQSQQVFVEPTASSFGWILEKKNNWVKVFSIERTEEPEKAESNDDLVRHIVSEDQGDRGWVVHSNGVWREEPLTHVKASLVSGGFSAGEINDIIGTQVLTPWTLVNKPFQPEYPGNREWNRNAAQIAFAPNPYVDETSFPAWTSILEHCGSGLNDVVKVDPWCIRHNVLTGGDYLLLWVASMLKDPYAPLPYLFLYGEQKTGKSTFHMALQLLLTRGYMRADTALGNTTFNGELFNAILCVIEETDLRGSKTAYNKIKDWVTSPDILMHPKGLTPYLVKNTTKWIHCSNEVQNCPAFTGDTRITMIKVPQLKEQIPPTEFKARLVEQASNFLGYVFKMEIPPSGDRLNVPILNTDEKLYVASVNKNPVELFIDENCHEIPGTVTLFSKFYEEFLSTIDMSEQAKWSRTTVSRAIPFKYPKGKLSNVMQAHIGNLTFHPDEEPSGAYYSDGSQILKKKGTNAVLSGVQS